MKSWIAAVLMLVAISRPSRAGQGRAAGEGGGTVADVDYPHIEVTTGDKKSVLIMLDANTVGDARRQEGARHGHQCGRIDSPPRRPRRAA
jgi:hypothetical protein